ncbi:MAG: 1-(5-phosphoribosyl)-5-[(5-phosphoribosylamino)methylideneamino]imidazole-4-carboxamide isomerase [Bacteroidales bacterium]|nr:1-(5-phosphoribosyl)-5-[(5-phosphoribosylamino)methylideneamino]imidazole-4-carboxamide isomerase [Bacteroidales bacterium]
MSETNKIEIIPAIDLIGGRTVRLSQGDYDRVDTYEATPAEAALRYVTAGFERIHVVDLDGAKASEPKNLETLRKISEIPGVRVEWGGGIKTREALCEVFEAGASYAVIGSVAAKNPDLFIDWLDEFGGEKMVFGADLLNGEIKINGWLEASDANLDSLLERFMAHGLQRTICTDISKDGMLSGPAFDMYARLQQRWPEMNFTVSGGISSMDDILKLQEMGMKSVIVGKALYEGHITLRDLMEFKG